MTKFECNLTNGAIALTDDIDCLCKFINTWFIFEFGGIKYDTEYARGLYIMKFAQFKIKVFSIN